MVRLPCADDLVYLDNGLVVAKWATLSNVAYLVAGIVGMYRTHQRTLHGQHQTAEVKAMSSPLVRPQHVMLLYAWIIMIGLASTIYHSSLQAWSLCMDFFAIEVFCFLLVWQLTRVSRALYWILVVLIMGSTVVLLLVATLKSSWRPISSEVYNILVSLMMMVIFCIIWDDLLVFQRRVRQPERDRWTKLYLRPHWTHIVHQSRWWFGTGSILLCVAFVCYFLPKYTCTLPRGSWYQMHSYWHVLSAGSLYCLVHTLTLIQQ